MVSSEWRRAFELGYVAGLHAAIRDLGQEARSAEIYERLGIPKPSRDEDLVMKQTVLELARYAQAGKKDALHAPGQKN